MFTATTTAFTHLINLAAAATGLHLFFRPGDTDGIKGSNKKNVMQLAPWLWLGQEDKKDYYRQYFILK
jgi:hypothetical protein